MSKSFYLGYNEAINYANSINDKRIYITDYTQTNYSPAVSEILTLFYLKVDPKIYQNKTLYQNIYKYVNFNSYNFDDVDNNNDKSGSKVFVFNIAEISKFDSSKYNIKVFENYGVATLKD